MPNAALNMKMTIRFELYRSYNQRCETGRCASSVRDSPSYAACGSTRVSSSDVASEPSSPLVGRVRNRMKTDGVAHKASMILPYGLRSALKKYKQYIYCRYFLKPSDPVELFTSEWYFRYLTRRFGGRIKSQDAGPVAPPELIKTEALMHADQLKGHL